MSAKNKILSLAESLNSVEMVYLVNESFGNVYGDKTKENIINQAKNLYDELDELQEALDTNDTKEVIDAIGDLLTFVYGIPYFKGLSSEHIHSIVPELEVADNQKFHDLIKKDVDHFIEAVESIDSLYGEYHDTGLRKLIASIKGLCVCNGVDEENLLHRITVSNMTKICATNEEMVDTITKYENMGVDVYGRYFKFRGVWVYGVYSSKEQTVNDKVYRKDKFLKSVYFEEPVLNDLCD